MTGFLFPMAHGPYQDNGASPWYAPIDVGTSAAPQVQKFALDTGTNMVWVTSTQCTTPACMMHNRFDAALSSTFAWVDPTPTTLDYGPWGQLHANIGRDVLNLPGGLAQPATFGLATQYHGDKFQEIDWDGCLAFPAQGPTQDGFSFLVEDLYNSGHLGPADGFVCFDWDSPGNTGSCLLGDIDPGKMVFDSGLFIPFSEYNAVAGVGYIWTGANARVSVGGKQLSDNTFFGFDSGSSRFKGDGGLITAIKQNLGGNTNDVTIEIGQSMNGQTGRITVPPDVYMRTIEAGQNKGATEPQFAILQGVPQLMIVGSVVMDYLYTVYVYERQTDPATGKYKAKPYGTWVFNKPGGPQILQAGAGGAGAFDRARLLPDY